MEFSSFLIDVTKIEKGNFLSPSHLAILSIVADCRAKKNFEFMVPGCKHTASLCCIHSTQNTRILSFARQGVRRGQKSLSTRTPHAAPSISKGCKLIPHIEIMLRWLKTHPYVNAPHSSDFYTLLSTFHRLPAFHVLNYQFPWRFYHF